ncbi:MAG TPA: hypothetical protein VLZ06_11400 [Solirubrobacteraceae bacterium]|nr:hypothetical protein [Solirubrobacteraceae bacterium]
MRRSISICIWLAVALSLLTGGASLTAGASLAAGVKLCVPKKEGGAVLTPKHGKCKRGYKLTGRHHRGRAVVKPGG